MRAPSAARVRQAITSTGLAVCAACASGAPRQSTPLNARVSESSNVVLSRQELARVGHGETLMAALRYARPWWFNRPGPPIAVSVDGAPATDLSMLASIPASMVVEVRLIRTSHGVGKSMVASDGGTILGDLIVVRTRSQ